MTTTIAMAGSQSVDDVERMVDIISDAFATVPLTRTFIVEVDSTPPPYPAPSIDLARRRRFFAQGISQVVNDGAIALQSGDWSAVAIWEPPGFAGTPFTTLGPAAGPLRTEWRACVAAAKKKHLGDRLFWHLGFLARNPAVAGVKGAVSVLVRPFLERAKSEGVPAWLEAVDERGVAIYAHYGFKLVDHVVIGEGTHNRAGWPEKGGEGVSGYFMIYNP